MDLYEFLWNITRFGGTHIVIPASIGLFVGLWRMNERASAQAFLFAAAFCFFCIVAAKVVLLTASGFSPSGHTAIAAFFYASIGFLAFSFRPSILSAALAFGLALLVVLIGVSRFAVAGHTRLEVVAGMLCGLASFELFRRAGPRPRANAVSLLRAAPVALVAAIIINRLMSLGFLEEEDIRGFSQWLRGELLGRT